MTVLGYQCAISAAASSPAALCSTMRRDSSFVHPCCHKQSPRCLHPSMARIWRHGLSSEQGTANTQNYSMHFPADVRARHLYICGQTGMGKSALLKNLIYRDLQNGDGLGVIDPHGELAKAAISYIPHWRNKELIYLNAEDRERPVSYNPL